MEIFFALLAFCGGNSPVTGEFPAQRPVTRNFDVFFYLGLYQQFTKQWTAGWFETPWRSLWLHCNDCSISCHFHRGGCNRPANLTNPTLRLSHIDTQFRMEIFTFGSTRVTGVVSWLYSALISSHHFPFSAGYCSCTARYFLDVKSGPDPVKLLSHDDCWLGHRTTTSLPPPFK